jgi:hypothetical protein
MNTNQLNRGDRTIQNTLRMLRPILEDKGIIGTVIKATELAKICRNHQRRLPLRSYRALDLADDINNMGKGGLFVFDDLLIQVYEETDFGTRRRSPSIEFQRTVSLEQQYLNSLKHEAPTQSADQTVNHVQEGQTTI